MERSLAYRLIAIHNLSPLALYRRGYVHLTRRNPRLGREPFRKTGVLRANANANVVLVIGYSHRSSADSLMKLERPGLLHGQCRLTDRGELMLWRRQGNR